MFIEMPKILPRSPTSENLFLKSAIDSTKYPENERTPKASGVLVREFFEVPDLLLTKYKVFIIDATKNAVLDRDRITHTVKITRGKILLLFEVFEILSSPTQAIIEITLGW